MGEYFLIRIDTENPPECSDCAVKERVVSEAIGRMEDDEASVIYSMNGQWCFADEFFHMTKVTRFTVHG